MYINKKDMKYLEQLVINDYLVCCNTKRLADKENNLKYADELMYREMYIKELLLEKFKVNENYLEDIKNKMFLGVTY